MRTKKAFTLMEFIITIVLVGILASITSTLLLKTFNSFFTGKNISDLATTTNIALTNLIRELKSSSSLTALNTSTLSFVNQQGHTVVIDLSGTTLRRNVDGAGAQTLCTLVTGLSFGFFDQAFATTTVPANVRFITIQITTSKNGLPYSVMGGTVLMRLLP
jgi:prepilin-type N-terminal cleavage/methylation domain-containing protein